MPYARPVWCWTFYLSEIDLWPGEDSDSLTRNDPFMPEERRYSAAFREIGPWYLKVIKHWYRNTLFKERQRNKDSPYNFNNPPSTVLNIEEYEKTGEPKVIQLDSGEKNDTPSKNKDLIKLEDEETNEESEERKHDNKSEVGEDSNNLGNNIYSNCETQSKFEDLRRLQMSLGLNVSSTPSSETSFNVPPFDAMFQSQMNMFEKHPLLHSPLAGNFPSPLGQRCNWEF